MNLYVTRRGLIRTVCFSLAALIILSILAYNNYDRARRAELEMEYNYLQSISDLGNYMKNIESALTKTMYTGTAAGMNTLTSKLWREAGFAKKCLSNLPMGSLNLESTYKFLSQVGDYCVSLSKKSGNGEEITEEERQNLSKLKQFSTRLLEQVLVAEDAIRMNKINYQFVKQDAKNTVNAASKDNTYDVSEGFLEFEEGFTAYPTLIYDGPFSDHLLNKQSELTKQLQQVSIQEAQAKAAAAAQVSTEQLMQDTDEDGNMPSYCFRNDTVDVGVTKQGGLITYFIKNRGVEDSAVSTDTCKLNAQRYLKGLGIESLQETYYEINNNIMVINYASMQGDVMCYTDLVKVGVAMDTGEIIRFDARGYITNHTQRTDITPSITAEQAQSSLSPLLNVQSSKLCLVPSDGQNEVLAYEFKCTSEENENILVYINAKTGAEQQIIILSISENGTLAI